MPDSFPPRETRPNILIRTRFGRTHNLLRQFYQEHDQVRSRVSVAGRFVISACAVVCARALLQSAHASSLAALETPYLIAEKRFRMTRKPFKLLCAIFFMHNGQFFCYLYFLVLFTGIFSSSFLSIVYTYSCLLVFLSLVSSIAK